MDRQPKTELQTMLDRFNKLQAGPEKARLAAQIRRASKQSEQRRRGRSFND